MDGISNPRIKQLLNMANTMTPVSFQCGELSIFPNKIPMMQAAKNSSQNREDRKVMRLFT